MLSVSQLVRDGHEAHINSEGGWITNLENGQHIYFSGLEGVYYHKMKMTKPCAPHGKEDQLLFGGCGA